MANRLRRRLYLLLENTDQRNPWGRRLQSALIALILINVFCVIFESEPSIYAEYADAFTVIEIISVLIFTAEYATRVWISVEKKKGRPARPLKTRLRYMLTPMALIDLASILPFWLQFITGVDLRVLRALRLLRIFKLTRYAPVVSLFLDVLREEAESIAAALFLLLVLMMVASSLMFLAEHQAQPESFSTIPKTMWWAVVTLTTVGYGDVVPITATGKIIAGFSTILGVGMVALPTGILLAGLQDQIHRRREAFRKRVNHMMMVGELSARKRAQLEKLREELGVDEDVAAEILSRLKAGEDRVCPHCGKPAKVPPVSEAGDTA
ncbi:MAG: ion transporter [Rhodospirillales bacterium]